MGGVTTEIWVPTRGHPWWGTIARLNEIGHPYRFMQNGISIAHTRNLIVREFLAGEADVLLMIDDDVIPHPDILRMPAELGEYAVAGAIVLTASPGTIHLPNVYERHGDSWARAPIPTAEEPERQVDGIGAGCMAVKRTTLAGMKAPFRFRHNEDGIVVVGEDLAFCERVARRKGKIQARYDLFSEHYDDVYAGGLAEAYMQVMGRVAYEAQG